MMSLWSLLNLRRFLLALDLHGLQSMDIRSYMQRLEKHAKQKSKSRKNTAPRKRDS